MIATWAKAQGIPLRCQLNVFISAFFYLDLEAPFQLLMVETFCGLVENSLWYHPFYTSW